MNSINSTRLREILNYDSLTGIFTWIVKPNKKLPAGIRAGCTGAGYRRIHFDGKLYMEHRLAWLYVYGEFPKLSLDHVNGDGLDNRISNLREATTKQNAQNTYGPQVNGTSGYLGVHWIPHKQKWRSRIQDGGKKISLGYFFTKEQAYKAYLEAKRKLHPFSNL